MTQIRWWILIGISILLLGSVLGVGAWIAVIVVRDYVRELKRKRDIRKRFIAGLNPGNSNRGDSASAGDDQ